MADEGPWKPADGALVLAVRLTPKGGRDCLEGVERLADGRHVLKVRVRAIASEGAANAALVRLIADSLGVARRQVTLVSGATSRVKRLRIEGDAADLMVRLERQVASSRERVS